MRMPSNMGQMEFNPSKCLRLTISNQHHHFNHSYYISNNLMQKFSRAKYLGVVFDEQFTWKNHICDICAKSNAALVFIKRNINFCPNHIKSNCYKTHLRIHSSHYCVPHRYLYIRKSTTYCSPICTDCSWRSSVTTMLISLDWPTLKSRHTYSKLVMFYKLINSHIDIPSLSLSQGRP